MKVVLSTPGKFHLFDLARQLHERGELGAIFTGYPHFKLRHEGLPRARIHSWPWLQSSYMAMPARHRLGQRALRQWEWAIRQSHDRHVRRHLPDCDVFVGLSGSALHSGRAARQQGTRYVCDRGSTHIRVQDELLREEARRWGLPFEGVDPRVIEREEAEYAEADCITVPSGFAVRSFVSQGVPAHKLRLLPYGVDLSRFQPTSQPDPQRFEVLFVGGMNLNKGLPYLLQAFQRLQHPHKRLTFAGVADPAFIVRLTELGLWSDHHRVLGHVPQHELADLMGRSHVMVLPSVQEGFGMVLSQAMASGCVTLATDHTGAPDLVTHGHDGLVVPARDARALADALQSLADDPLARQAMVQRGLLRVAQAGGWRDYGEQASQLYRSLLET